MVIFLITNSKELKKINIQNIKNVLKNNDYCTKISLAKKTGLSVATCGNLLNDLLKTGEVLEIEKEPSSGGRPSRKFIYNKNFSYISTVYVRKEGSTNSLSIFVINLGNEILFEKTFEYGDIGTTEIEYAVKRIIEKFPKIKILSIGIPGVVKDGTVSSCDFEKLDNKNLIDLFKKKYGLKAIVENDVNACAIGYFNKNLSANEESFVYIYFPMEGMPGSGIIINKKIIRGKSNFAGEISYLPIGTERDFQGKIQKNSDSFSEYVCNIVHSINCVINPGNIVLAGYSFSKEILEKVNVHLQAKIHKEHIPKITYERDIKGSYLEGLKYLAMENISEKIQIIKK
ncbi:MAG: hypothetical protein PWQ77_2028 [Kosmotogales bacterium]|nr:hypothetical protein [Kosmotogales bacterium]